MKCPECTKSINRVIDKRETIGWQQIPAIRRRRVCLNCTHRWTTREIHTDDWRIFNQIMDLIERKRK